MKPLSFYPVLLIALTVNPGCGRTNAAKAPANASVTAERTASTHDAELDPGDGAYASSTVTPPVEDVVSDDSTPDYVPANGNAVGRDAHIPKPPGPRAAKSRPAPPPPAPPAGSADDPGAAAPNGPAFLPPPSHRADNTAVNTRDRGDTLTPMDQGTSEADRSITQKIRQAVVAAKGLSFDGKNVKIITIGGKVTLRGPVKTLAERATIESKAKQTPGVVGVDNQLDVLK